MAEKIGDYMKAEGTKFIRPYVIIITTKITNYCLKFKLVLLLC